MRKILLAFVSCSIISAASSAFADGPPVPAPSSEARIKLELTNAELQVIGQGLMELPYKLSAQVLNDIQAQLNATAKAKADSPADPEKK
jgi:hypothetical protein